jgi:hypothetical protein
VVPLPLSGRFYESGEFHMVGHVSRLGRSPAAAALPTTMPLYGLRIPTRQAAWNYAVLHNNVRLPVYLSASPRDTCMGEIGCLELQSGDVVLVPAVDAAEGWRAKMYSRL